MKILFKTILLYVLFPLLSIAQSTVTLESFDLGDEISLDDVCNIAFPTDMQCPGGARPVLGDGCSYVCPAEQEPRGCSFVGDYTRTVVELNSTLRCSGPPPRPVVLCNSRISCRVGSELHQQNPSQDQSSPINMRIICLANAEGNCPTSIATCLDDNDVSNYLDSNHDASHPVRTLRNQTTSGQ